MSPDQVSRNRAIWELLDQFLSQEWTAEERARVKRWIERTPVHALPIDDLLATTATPVPAGLKAEAWARLRRKLAASENFSLAPRSPPLAMARLVAGVIIAAGVGLAMWQALSISRNARSDVAPRVITTPAGQRVSFQLPDGTRVMLGVASTLRHPAKFGHDNRVVELEGEAYFEVAEDKRRIFAVRAGNAVAQDLGTKFMVRAYPDQPPHVVVREGRVGLRTATAPRASVSKVLLAGQLGRLAPDGRTVVEQADTAAYFAWTQGWLVLDALPLREALPKLSRWYDLDFRLADTSLGRVPLTVRFQQNQATNDLLKMLAASLGMRQVRQGRVVTFYPVTEAR